MPPPVDVTNAKTMTFFVERQEKEAYLRAAWNLKHEDKIKRAAILNREFKNDSDVDVLAATMAAGLAATSREHTAAARHRHVRRGRDGRAPGLKDLKAGHSIAEVGLGDARQDPRLAREPPPVMRPVAPALAALLRDRQPGRRRYLRERERAPPEQRYYFAECTSWEYGWRTGDSGTVSRQAPRLGRRDMLAAAIRSNRVGPQPDPEHYSYTIPPYYSRCP